MTLYTIGAASGIAGKDPRAGLGPGEILSSTSFQSLVQAKKCWWVENIQMENSLEEGIVERVAEFSERLAITIQGLVKRRQIFAVIGGDHACAIGTWSGVQAALSNPFGLLWVDAHLDAHTFETSPSQNIHGMPVASLLGYGKNLLTHILNLENKLRPEYLCMVGVRSFEAGEHELIQQLGVKVYYMDEVKQRGIATVLREGIAYVRRAPGGYGITIDLDGFDPKEAPGVSTPEKDGLSAHEFCKVLPELIHTPEFLGVEIAEFNPEYDQEKRTANLITNILKTVAERI